MNEKGFTLMELLATIVIMSFILIMIYPSITKLIRNNDEKKYSSYEDMMVEYTVVNKNKDKSIIQLDELDELHDIKKECVGYVVNTNGQYKAYISCGDNGEKYQTDGFLSSKVE